MGGLRNPVWGGAVQEKYIYLERPDSADKKRIKELEGLLAEMESARGAPVEPEIKEVVREVFMEDASLIAERDSLRQELSTIRSEPKPVAGVEVRVVEVEKVVQKFVLNTRLALVVHALGIAYGVLACLALFGK